MAAIQEPKSIHHLADKKIIVAGAGIAGLSFALSLVKQWQDTNPNCTTGSLPFKIIMYERDAEDQIGREGYSMSIRKDSGGVQALEKLGLADCIDKKTRECNDTHLGGLNMWNSNWERLMKIPSQGKGGPMYRVPRDVLRKTLVDKALEVGVPIIWSTVCERAEKLDSGMVRVTLDRGKTDDGDILVVADGSSSKLRGFLRPDDKLRFAGATCIVGTSNFPQGLPDPIGKEFGMVISGQGTGMFTAPIDRTTMVWSVSYLASEPRAVKQQPLSTEEAEALKKEALELAKVYSEPSQTIIGASDLSKMRILNAKDKQPFAHSGDDVTIIFIGDSNHAMSPFAGNGANMALADGWDLAQSLYENESRDAAVALYDKLSIPRSTKAIKASHFAISGGHSSGLRYLLMRIFFAVVRFFFSR